MSGDGTKESPFTVGPVPVTETEEYKEAVKEAGEKEALSLAAKTEKSEQMTLRRARQIEVENRDLQADNDRLRRKVKKLEDSYVPQDVVGECIQFLRDAGYGKEGESNTLWAMVRAACTRTTRLHGAVKMARDELGVPTPDYPAPVTNAAEILNAVLDGNPPVGIIEVDDAYECSVCGTTSCGHIDAMIRSYEESNDRQLEVIAQWEMDANNWPTLAEFTNLQDAYEDLEKENAPLNGRHEEHLRLIRTMSTEITEMTREVEGLTSRVEALEADKRNR